MQSQENRLMCKETHSGHGTGQLGKGLAVSLQWLITSLPLLGCSSCLWCDSWQQGRVGQCLY